MYAKFFKRFLDIILSLCAVIVLSPILLILIVLGTMFMRGNPFFFQERPGKDEKNSELNFWLSCMNIDKDAMYKQVRGEQEALYVGEHGKSCPTEILEAIASINAECRPIWKPMHMQPIYRMNPFVVRDGNGRARTNAYIDGGCLDVGMDVFERGLCLPSDKK